MTEMASLSHVSICVSDLEHSAKFYTGAFGFELEHYVAVTAPFDRMTELPGMVSRAGFFHTAGGTRIELLGYETPAVIGPSERRAMNQLGITHLSLIVADLDTTADRICVLGGRALHETRCATPFGDLMFATDPDGTRIELWAKVEPA